MNLYGFPYVTLFTEYTRDNQKVLRLNSYLA